MFCGWVGVCPFVLSSRTFFGRIGPTGAGSLVSHCHVTSHTHRTAPPGGKSDAGFCFILFCFVLPLTTNRPAAACNTKKEQVQKHGRWMTFL